MFLYPYIVAFRMFITGHRGVCGYEPENTFRSFQKAIDCGVDALELDVHLSKDNYLVVIHDYRVERTTNGQGLVSVYTREELQQLDAGKGEKIPRLDEVYDFINKRARIAIEVKGFGLEERIASFVKVRNAYGYIHVCSYNQEALCAIKTQDRKISTGLIFEGVPYKLGSLLVQLDVDAYYPNPGFILPEHIEIVQHTSCQVHVYALPIQEEVTRLVKWGVDGLLTDYPDVTIKMVQAALLQKK